MPEEPPASWPSPAEALDAIAGSTGTGVKVAVIDSGIDLTHPVLADLELTDNVAVSSDGIRLNIRDLQPGGESGDVFGHGTAVAGVLRETAPGVRIGSFRALDRKNQSRSFIIAECVRQAIARGYQIINCSFGCRGLAKYMMDYKEWVDQAYVAGVHVIAACSNVHYSVREWPAHFPSVISVGVADCGDDDLIFRPAEMVSLAAKGERVRVPWLDGGWRIETGSSFAAPRVAGFVARLLSVFPDLRPDQVKALLCAAARTDSS